MCNSIAYTTALLMLTLTVGVVLSMPTASSLLAVSDRQQQYYYELLNSRVPQLNWCVVAYADNTVRPTEYACPRPGDFESQTICCDNGCCEAATSAAAELLTDRTQYDDFHARSTAKKRRISQTWLIFIAILAALITCALIAGIFLILCYTLSSRHCCSHASGWISKLPVPSCLVKSVSGRDLVAFDHEVSESSSNGVLSDNLTLMPADSPHRKANDRSVFRAQSFKQRFRHLHRNAYQYDLMQPISEFDSKSKLQCVAAARPAVLHISVNSLQNPLTVEVVQQQNADGSKASCRLQSYEPICSPANTITHFVNSS